METFTIEQPIWKFSIDGWKSQKDKLLSEIKQGGIFSIKESGNTIYNTDYHLANSKIPSFYKDTAVSTISSSLEMLSKKYNLRIEVTKLWYQQYKKGDFHAAHNHGGTNFSSVLYVELPENTQTSFYFDYEQTQEYKLDVKEGDYIIFPSSIVHESKPLELDETKTIISYNLSIEFK